MALNSHRNLGMVSTAQARASQRLSSGFRINSAADDAAGLGISEKMRGQIRGLNQAARNAQDGISLIQTAEGAMATVNEIVLRIRELVVQAANDTNVHETDVSGPSPGPDHGLAMANSDRVRIQDEINQLMDEIDMISSRTEFNTRVLLDGSWDAGNTRITGWTTVQEPIFEGGFAAALNVLGNSPNVSLGEFLVANGPWADRAELDLEVAGMGSWDGLLDDHQQLFDDWWAANSAAVNEQLGTNYTSFDQLVNTATVSNPLSINGETFTVANWTSALGGALNAGITDQASLMAFLSNADNAEAIADRLSTVGGGAGIQAERIAEALGLADAADITADVIMEAFVTGTASQAVPNNMSFGELLNLGAGEPPTLRSVLVNHLTMADGPNMSVADANALIDGIAEQTNGGAVVTGLLNFFDDDASEVTWIDSNGDEQEGTIRDRLMYALDVWVGEEADDFDAWAEDNFTARHVGYRDVQVATREYGTSLWLHIGANVGQGLRVTIGSVSVDNLSRVAHGINHPQGDFTGAGQPIQGSGFEFHQLRTVTQLGYQGIGIPEGRTEMETGHEGILHRSGEEINQFLTTIDLALSHTTAIRSRLGAVQNRLEFSINNLQVSSENLSASESRIRDADMALEMMRLTQANVLQQAATVMLAQANQAPQSILQLLG